MECVCKQNKLKNITCIIALLCAMLCTAIFYRGGVQHNASNESFSLLSHVLDIVFPKMEVQAATKDANGHTVATDLSGQAYAVFCEDNTTLYLLRDNTIGRKIGSSYTVTDTDGSTHSGEVTQNDIDTVGGAESSGYRSDQYSHGSYLISDYTKNYTERVTKIICLDDIYPTSMASWCYGMSGLISFDTSRIDTSRCKSMGEMLSRTSISTIDMSGFNTSKCEEMNGIFAECPKLQSIDLSNWDTSEATCMNGMFTNDSSIESIDVSNFSASDVGPMHNMFDGCENLSTLNTSNWNIRQIDKGHFSNCYTYGMFANCKKLKSIDLSGLTITTDDMHSMFDECNSLSSLQLPNISIDQRYKVNLNSMFVNGRSPVLGKKSERIFLRSFFF